jgi:hypothetical protein
VTPQPACAQLVVACAPAGQGVHELPQLAGLVSLTQAPLHACEPALQLGPVIARSCGAASVGAASLPRSRRSATPASSAGSVEGAVPSCQQRWSAAQ